MKDKRSALPNFFTLTNVFLGFLALIYATDGRFSTAAWCLVFATFCDLVDGKLARLSKVYSSFGKELDSLADVISFGVAPAYLVYQSNFSMSGMWGAFFCFIYIMAGIFRLARFNVDTKSLKKNSYKGLPIPVAALAISSFILFAHYFWDTVKIVHVLLMLIPVLSLLMVSSIKFDPIPSLIPRKNMKKNIKPALYIAGFVSIIINPSVWFFPWTMLYIIIEVVEGVIQKFKETSEKIEVPIDNEQEL